MSNSPCRNCEFALKDKNRSECLNCKAKERYVASMGGMTHSLPIEQTDMARKRKVIQFKSSKKPQTKKEFKMPKGNVWTDQDDQFLRDNFKTMNNWEISKRLNRTPNAVQFRLSTIGLRRNNRQAVQKELVQDKRAARQPKKIIIDFAGYDDLYEKFMDYIKTQFRTAEEQILYLINQDISHRTRLKGIEN